MEKRYEEVEWINWYRDFDKIKEMLPEESPICSEHDESVSVSTESYLNPGSGTPNIEVVFNYCCEDALKNEINFRDRMLSGNKPHSNN